MCGLFGMFDYQSIFSPTQRNHILNALARESESRGRDATGIAYLHKHKLQIYKRPLPATRLNLCVPPQTNLIMGHTRAATQGSSRLSQNNHPFYGKAGRQAFALAHNGIIVNDYRLRSKHHLPATKVETDSYVCVQLLEQQKSLAPSSLANMAELADGSFTFTLLDQTHLSFIKGNSPLCIYHFKGGCYLYASTEEILTTALQRIPFALPGPQEVSIHIGEILQLDENGRQTKQTFRADHLLNNRWYGCSFFPPPLADSFSRLDELYDYAGYVGVDPADVDELIQCGASVWEVEELLGDPAALRQLLQEVRCGVVGEVVW